MMAGALYQEKNVFTNGVCRADLAQAYPLARSPFLVCDVADSGLRKVPADQKERS